MARAALALLLAAAMLALAGAAHVHAAPQHGDECVSCATSHVAAAPAAVVAVELRLAPEIQVAVAPGEPAADGAPLGAIPGQSPPVA